ncbi:sucrase ferredoxin [Streptomyces kronopolitis]|uniref:Sucrase ferredoxin n=1 Tax=Streptomyces kronopolitis TaxID=1612435 RepID=A0ABQ2J184_9ACTN|nr:sucrase ferredoxin [Streptomyces kronopolitis]GGN36166.1 sucrase ferredoxin [Streptomyces kronopolitis]
MSTCATASRESAESLTATAATARTWLLIEQTGPWGAQALTNSHLDPDVGRALEAATEGTGVRVALIRRPGRHADCNGTARHRMFLAHTAPGRTWIRTTTVSDPRAALGLDFTALGAGEHHSLWEPYIGEPLVLVCTNGKRDRCCALLGRPLAAELAASGAEAWEVTHIGGHRFSPTLFVLPFGYAYGRASAPLVKEAVEAARDGRITIDHCRGRSAWDRPGQAADLAVRELLGEDRADALDVVRTDTVRPEPRPAGSATPGGSSLTGASSAWAVTVAHSDGRSWQVTVEQRADGAAAPASCGAPLGPPARMAVVSIDAVNRMPRRTAQAVGS